MVRSLGVPTTGSCSSAITVASDDVRREGIRNNLHPLDSRDPAHAQVASKPTKPIKNSEIAFLFKN